MARDIFRAGFKARAAFRAKLYGQGGVLGLF